MDLSHPLTLFFAKKNNANYERYNGYKLLYGKIDIQKSMPKQSFDKIKTTDGTNYFLTRGSGLILAGYCLAKYNDSIPKIYITKFRHRNK